MPDRGPPPIPGGAELNSLLGGRLVAMAGEVLRAREHDLEWPAQHDAPTQLITDGQCDAVRIRRE